MHPEVAPDPSSSGTSVIHADGVGHVHAGTSGVHDLDLEVPSGCIFGLVGPSGSGKTTAVRLVLGLIEPEDGTLAVFGKAPREFGPADRARVGYLPQESVLDPDLSLRHNLQFMASLYGLPWRIRWLPGKRARATRERIDEVLDLMDLHAHLGTRLRDASTGEQRRLAIAAALVHDPDLLVLDEPTAGIDPVLREQLWNRFATLRDRGRTLFITTQYVTEADHCDLVGLVVDGEILRVDTPDSLRRGAFGGDLVEVHWNGTGPALTDLLAVDGVRGIRDFRGADGVVLLVEDGARDAARLQDWLRERGDEETVAMVHRPSFDDAFVRLVTAHRARRRDPAERRTAATTDSAELDDA